jgi:ABC-type lipoprotein release transport system permease subunit
MGKFLTIVWLGVKYLYRYRRRYGFLAAAMIFCFAIVTFITSAKDGMYDSVYYSAQSHYAGDIVAIGYDSLSARDFCHRLGKNEMSAILNAASFSGITPQYTVFRTFSGSDAVIHYNGEAVQLKNLIGCDWDRESHLFSKMSFEQPPEPSIGDDGIVISLPIAQQLNAKMGDMVILETETRFGQKNTGQFIIKGIVRDTSIFGYYKAYVSRLVLNRLIAYEDGDCSSVGFFLGDPLAAEQKRARLQEFLSGLVQTGPLVYDRDELAIERDRPWNGIRVFLYTMPVYLSEVSSLLDAINILTYFLYGMMLVIILVSAAVTYRLILHERAREMGTMRVIGFHGGDLRLVLLSEIIVLGLISLIAGFIFARVLSWAVSFLSFSWFPSFEIFLKNGKLTAMYLPGTILINIFTIFIILFMVALPISFRVTKKNLPNLLSGESL